MLELSDSGCGMRVIVHSMLWIQREGIVSGEPPIRWLRWMQVGEADVAKGLPD